MDEYSIESHQTRQIAYHSGHLRRMILNDRKRTFKGLTSKKWKDFFTSQKWIGTCDEKSSAAKIFWRKRKKWMPKGIWRLKCSTKTASDESLMQSKVENPIVITISSTGTNLFFCLLLMKF